MKSPGLIALVAGVLLSGCAGYRLGPTNGLPAGAQSVQVNLFQNATPEPRLSPVVAQALRKSLQQDGTFQLATRNPGDVVLDGVITAYDRSALSFDPRDVITGRDFDVFIVAQVTATERLSGKRIFQQDVRGRTTVRAGLDLASAEFQSVPLLAEDLARRITDLLADGTW